MDIRKNTIRNSLYALLTQGITMVIQFVIRKAALEYIGVEILGIKDTVTSIIGIMTLAEGGFGSAIIFSLYQPLSRGDTDKVNRLMNVFRRVYHTLAFIVIGIGLAVAPFLKYLLKGVALTPTVYVIYFLICVNTAASYLLGYKRAILSADVREFIAKRIDIVCNILFNLLNLAVILLLKNYVVVLLVTCAQTVAANLVVHVKCRAYYPYLKPEKVDPAVMHEVTGYSKNLIVGNLAAYVYNSTDNIIISSGLGTVSVGYLGNYTSITNALRALMVSILGAITPTLGRLQGQYTDIGEKRTLFYRYYQLCYGSALAVCIPLLLLLDGFIAEFFGAQYLMTPSIKWLLTAILYIYIAPMAYGNFITTNGKFEALRRVEMVGAFLNLGSSILLVILIGLPGILLGTVLSGAVQWLMRSHIVYRGILEYSKRDYFRWLLKGFYRIGLALLCIAVSGLLVSRIQIAFYPAAFILQGMTCEITVATLYLILYRFRDRITVKELLRLLRRESA